MARDTRLLVERWAPWVAGAVLLAGVAAFAVTRFTGGATASTQAVPLSSAASLVAREFVATAVARKDLARAWTLAAPALKHGTTFAEWKTGTIRVQPYPVSKAAATYKTQSSTRDAAVPRVTFVPPPASPTPGGDFVLTLQRLGGRWLVSGWAPRSLVGPRG
ncbi:MAG: hypothetical protein ACYDBR_11310 [Gaiellaceae bacterium]